MNSIQNVPNELKSLYQRNFDSIKTRVIRGRIKTMYHFLITDSYNISTYVDTVKSEQHGAIKLNAAFGFILKHIESNELRYFHPSNNSTIFKEPVIIGSERDYIKLLDDLEREDLMEYASLQRPSTKWRVVKLVCLRFDVYKL